ncbi:MAG: hypothetical protein RMJ19_05180 [Gemmatales bacterium]|nr:hypothetical protein [Gemmatales bacterium]MCS7159846.1 hypothetical protein [Gemmatales bacterium]MDW8175045.1 hypothetical protein [Gemmatales bacterium]MDW8221663.1 hypothetical protein [Gemmatales bacterium]
MRKPLLALSMAGLLWSVCPACAGDYQLQTGLNLRWYHPSWVWWASARGPHGGHWMAIGHPPEMFHPYPWFLVYPTGVTWPSTSGWSVYGGNPDTPWAGYTYYPSAGLSAYPGWPNPTGTSPLAQPPITGAHAPPLPATGWPAPQMPPYYWFGR